MKDLCKRSKALCSAVFALALTAGGASHANDGFSRGISAGDFSDPRERGLYGEVVEVLTPDLYRIRVDSYQGRRPPDHNTVVDVRLAYANINGQSPWSERCSRGIFDWLRGGARLPADFDQGVYEEQICRYVVDSLHGQAVVVYGVESLRQDTEIRAQVFIDGNSFGRHLVREGHAVSDYKAGAGYEYAEAERMAITQRKGMWSKRNPEEFR